MPVAVMDRSREEERGGNDQAVEVYVAEMALHARGRFAAVVSRPSRSSRKRRPTAIRKTTVTRNVTQP